MLALLLVVPLVQQVSPQKDKVLRLVDCRRPVMWACSHSCRPLATLHGVLLVALRSLGSLWIQHREVEDEVCDEVVLARDLSLLR